MARFNESVFPTFYKISQSLQKTTVYLEKNNSLNSSKLNKITKIMHRSGITFTSWFVIKLHNKIYNKHVHKNLTRMMTTVT